MGEDGEVIATYMLSVMDDERARTADRIEAATWLSDRGFGRPVPALDIDVGAYPYLDLTTLTLEDLEVLRTPTL